MKVFIKGLNSCVMRRQTLERYRQVIHDNGQTLVATPEESDVILVWTCGFRADVRDNSLEQLERYQERWPGKVVAAGCIPDISPDLLSERFSGTVLPWKSDQEGLERLFGRKADEAKGPPVFVEAPLCEDTTSFRAAHPDRDATFHDQFVKLVVAEGCNFKCSYCSERLAFPAYRSFSPERLVAQCREMVAASGCKNVMLLADSLGEYGHDLGLGLPELMQRLLEIDPALRLALYNLNPASFINHSEALFEFLRAGRICHLNLPIQSASASVLKRMNRTYSREELDRLFTGLNRLNFTAFDTHVIVGFPGETDADIDETVAFLLRHRPRYVLVSVYMDTPDAPAHRLPDQVPREKAMERIQAVESRFQAAGILCNSEESAINRDRLRRVNGP
ncbi:MAG: radical SAM protein [Magnetococcales bacterium]|nr:radical SAM protein [Magnetococcales bacterium]